MEIITTGDFMNRFCGTLGLARDIQRAATTIAKRAVDLDLVPGRSPISVAAAAIYMASQVIFSCRRSRADLVVSIGVLVFVLVLVFVVLVLEPLPVLSE